MKVTDFAPRASAFLTCLTGEFLTGIEVGCDVGAHAHAILQYCDIDKLYLVDLWEREFCQGYCQGRLHSHGYRHKVEMIKGSSHNVASSFKNPQVDFIYIDIPHDYDTVRQSLRDWWPHLKCGGVLGYRNYAASNVELKKAVDEFIADYKLEHTVESYHGEIIIFKP